MPVIRHSGAILLWVALIGPGIARPLATLAAEAAAPQPKQVKFQITGLFNRERVETFRALCKQSDELQLVSVDFDAAEAVLEFDPAKVCPGAPPEKYHEHIDNRLKGLSRHTIGARPPQTLARDKQQRIEIPAAALDCQACCLAAYETLMRIEGVQQATASFKEGRITAWIDPARTDRGKLVAALTQLGVELKDNPRP